MTPNKFMDRWTVFCVCLFSVLMAIYSYFYYHSTNTSLIEDMQESITIERLLLSDIKFNNSFFKDNYEFNNSFFKDNYEYYGYDKVDDQKLIKGFYNVLKKHGKLVLSKNNSCYSTNLSISSNTGKIACLKIRRRYEPYSNYSGQAISETCPEMTLEYLNEESFSIKNIKAQISDNYPDDIISCAHQLIRIENDKMYNWKHSLNEAEDKVISWAHYKSDKQLN